MDRLDFTDKYNTKLTDKEEVLFQQWAKANNRERDTYDYDLRGAWKELMSGTMSEADNGHLGDRYKKPNHPTFSNESIYNGVDGYVGGQWVQKPDGSYSFIVGKNNLYPKEKLQKYFETVEPNTELVFRDVRSNTINRLK